MTRRKAAIALAAALGVLALVALRDPPWLLSLTSGLGSWETDAAGVRYRWMRGHASFFVRSDAQVLIVPLRATFDRPPDWPIVATIAIDDRLVDRVVLSAPEWRSSTLRMPPRGSRRSRRIDIRLDRMRDDAHGAQLGEIRIR